MYVGHKTQICRTSPPRSANICPDISLTYIFISPLNVPSLATEKSRTPPLHAAAAAFVARCRSPPPPPRSSPPHATTARRTPPPPLTVRMHPRGTNKRLGYLFLLHPHDKEGQRLEEGQRIFLPWLILPIIDAIL